MSKSFWTRISVLVLAATGAMLAYRADIKFVPSVLILVSALMVTRIFAEIEDRLLADASKKDSYLLNIVRIARPSLLLLMGVGAIALLL
jgi:hypothetical protein